MVTPRDTDAGHSTTQPQLMSDSDDSRDSRPPISDGRHEYRAGEMLGGKYQLVRVIGEGGMGAVWLAKNITLDVDVAVKLIRRERASPEAAQRLLQEAKAAARLGHPSIVRVFDFGESEFHDPYIVMEALNGESLRDLLARKKRLTPERTLRTLMPVAGALISAHARGIVHRDLKPDNIILMADESGVVVPKIVDFGIAKLHQDALNAVRVTLTGQIMGSPGYMSPEQLDGRTDIDLRTDVWTFAVVFYEAATGTRPFDGAHYNAMLSAILLRDPVPMTELEAGDAALWSIIAKGLAKEVKERWPSMRVMGAALAEWALERGIQTDITGSSLAAHWSPTSEGPQSDAPPPDHEVIFSLDEGPATEVKPPEFLPPELLPTERPPERGRIPSMTPIPDTVPANTSLLDPSFPRPPSLGSFDPNPRGASAAPPMPLPAPRFGPPPKMPSYIPLPMERPEPPRLTGALNDAAPPSEQGRSFGGPLLWVAAFAFVIGIVATWLIHGFSKTSTTAPSTPSSTEAPAIVRTGRPAPSINAPEGTSPSGAPSSAAVDPSAASVGPTLPTGPAATDADAGVGLPAGYMPAPGSTLQPKLGGPWPSTSTGKPLGKPNSSAMPLPSAPNF